jgi:hypothetical protein
MPAGERAFRTVLGSRLWWCGLLVVLAALVPATTAAAATLFVTTRGSDNQACTRSAPCRHIAHAVAVARSGDTIVVGRGQFEGNVTLPARLRTIAVRGAGAELTGVSGSGSGSVFSAEGRATLAGLSIGNGSASTGGGIEVLDTGSLTLRSDSVAFNSAIFGGGVFVEGGGSLTVTDSAIFANQAGFEGGGIYVGAGSGRLRVIRSAVYQNVVTADGGAGAGVFTQASGRGPKLFADDTIALNSARGANSLGGGVFGDDLTFVGDTIADNSAVAGGGLDVDWTPSSALDTIVAGNSGGNCSAPFHTSEYDLEDDAVATCGLSAADHDIVGSAPQLGGLAANGGPTETMALSPGSTAVDNGNCSALVRELRADVDQRGRPRRFGARGVCDIGAWDSGGSMSGLVVETGGAPDATVGLPYRLTLDATGGIGRPYTWSVTSGALAPGLSLSSSGVVTGTSARSGEFVFTVSVTDSGLPTAHVATQSLALTVNRAPRPAVWLANPAHIQVDAFAPHADLDGAPRQILAGHLADVVAPDALTFDARGDLYVADTGVPAIWVYQSGAGGDVAPVRAITGRATGLVTPADIALGPGPTLYASDQIADAVTEYSAGADGDVAPLRTIAGPRTRLNEPGGLGVDRAGHLWVANTGSGTVTEYARHADGNAAPLLTIAAPGHATRLGIPTRPGLARTPRMAVFSTHLPTAALGSGYRERLTAVLDQPPLRWRLIGGSLPHGLRLSRGGLVTGRASRPGTARFTVVVRDSSRPALHASGRITLAVRQRPVITAVRPRRGPASGGRRVVIVGDHLDGTTTLAFGAMRAVGVHCVDGVRCTAWTPPHAAGMVRLSATVGGVGSAARREPRYRFR